MKNMFRSGLVAGLLFLGLPTPLAWADDPAAGLTESHLSVDGDSRGYYFYEPESLKGKTKPLVIVFHGGQGNGIKVARQSAFTRVADRHGFAVAFPNSMGYWNDGRATVGTDREDIDFVRSLIDHLVAEHHIDRSRVYATGVSNGGMFTLRLACEMSNTFAAFAPVAGSFPVSYYPHCKPDRPVPIMMFNGTADHFIQWAGGTILKGRHRGAGGEVIPVPKTVEFWRHNNGCAADPKVTDLPDVDKDDGTTVQVLTYGQCRDGDTVKLVKIEGGGHSWPGTESEPPFFIRRLMGPISHDINASEAMWAFFKHFRLPHGLSAGEKGAGGQSVH